MNEQRIAKTIADILLPNRWSHDVTLEGLAAHIAQQLTHQDKREKLTGAIGHFPVLVVLDPRCDLVSVPEALRSKHTLVLRVGHGLTPPIRDLTIAGGGFSGTFSFNRAPFLCTVPWEAVFMYQNERRDPIAVWPSSVPRELTEAPPAAKRAHLSIVPPEEP